MPPIQMLRPNLQPWKGGVLSLDPTVERLRQLLPATFEELPIPLAVGVVDKNGKHTLVRSGPLPEAVAASAAIPMIFAAVDVPGKCVTSIPSFTAFLCVCPISSASGDIDNGFLHVQQTM